MKIQQNIQKRLEKEALVVYPSKGVDPINNFPFFTLIEKDLKPIYRKEPIKGFDLASDEIKRKVREMNDQSSGSFFISQRNKNIAERNKLIEQNDETTSNKQKEKTQDMNHIPKGLIPLYTVINNYEVKRVYHTRTHHVSESMALSKEQLTVAADKKKESETNQIRVKELKNMLKTSESVGSVNSLKKDLAELELEYLSMNNKKKNKFHTVGKVAFSKGSPKGSDQDISRPRLRDRIGDQSGKRNKGETVSLFKDKVFDMVKRNMRTTQFNIEKNLVRKKINFQVQRDNLMSEATQEVIDTFTSRDGIKKEDGLKFIQLKDRVTRLNRQKELMALDLEKREKEKRQMVNKKQLQLEQKRGKKPLLSDGSRDLEEELEEYRAKAKDDWIPEARRGKAKDKLQPLELMGINV